MPPGAGTEASAPAADKPSQSDAELVRVCALLEAREFGRALAAGEALRARLPESRELLYALAVCQRHLKRPVDALATLALLERAHPKFTRLFQERGQCHVALRCADEAIRAFERAVRLCPALPASWRALEGLYRIAGREADSVTAARHVAKLASLPREVVTAWVKFADGDLYEAEGLVRQFLLAHGDHIEGMRLWPGSAWSSTCWTMPNCCWRAC